MKLRAGSGAVMTFESPKENSVSLDDVFGEATPENPAQLPASPAISTTGDTPTLVGDTEPVPSNEDSQSKSHTGLRTVVEWVAVVVVAIAVALLIRESAFQAFEIPSASMEPTVVPGDRILVNKLSYRFGDVGRGDLVVFDRPEDTPGDTPQLIKRVVGLPGETLEVREDGQLWITQPGQSTQDAVLLLEPYLPGGPSLRRPSVNLPVEADIWAETCANQPREPGVCTLSDETYLVLGDNRNSSVDSRSFGPIPEETIVGRAFARIWPLGDIGGL